MIGWLRGVVLEKAPGTVLLDVNGVGYRLAVPSRSVDEIGGPGEEASFHVHTHVREDAILLFGFKSRSELRLFEQVVGVSGVGPKLALAILSHLTPESFARAVVHGDSSALTKVPGIGKKTAARIVLELKDRLAEQWSDGAARGEARPVPAGSLRADAVAALMALGYTQPEAERAVSEAAASDATDLSKLVTAALRRLDRTF